MYAHIAYSPWEGAIIRSKGFLHWPKILFAKIEQQLIKSMMSYNNVIKIMTDTHSKSFAKLVCCNVGKEIHYVTVNIIITSGK